MLKSVCLSHSLVGRLEGASSLLRMMALHMSTDWPAERGSPRRYSRARQWANRQRVGGPGEPVRTAWSWFTRHTWFAFTSTWRERLERERERERETGYRETGYVERQVIDKLVIETDRS